MLGYDGAFVLALAVGALLLLASGRVRIDLVALGLIAVLALTGILSTAEAFSGFSNTAVITIAAMLVVSDGVYRTGILNRLANQLTRLTGGAFWPTAIATMVLVGVISAFINNTAAVAMLLPVMLGLAKDLDVSASKLLMPLSFASMFGGVCTLIGTSTNLIVDGVARRHGLEPFSIFELTPLGLVIFGAGLGYMVAIGIGLIPNRRTKSRSAETFDIHTYLTRVRLTEGSSLVGKRLEEAVADSLSNLDVLAVHRGAERRDVPKGEQVLEAGDRLLVRCRIEDIEQLPDTTGLRIEPLEADEAGRLDSSEAVVLEAVVAPDSELDGRRLRSIHFREQSKAVPLALRARGELRYDELDQVQLRGGDALLMQVRRDDLEALKKNPNFVFVSEAGMRRFRSRKLGTAVAIAAAVVLSAALGWMPIAAAAMGGAVAMVATGCIRLQEAYQAVRPRILVLLAGVLALGRAMDQTGVVRLVADAVMAVSEFGGPRLVLATLFFATAILTELVTNNATAALMAPIAIELGHQMGVDPRPMLVAVMVAASVSFLTPIGYQTNTLVYGPGNYRFTDFTRVGLPLNLLFLGLGVWLIPVFWPM